MNKIKDFLYGILGPFGCIASVIFALFPIIMTMIAFDLPIWWNFIFVAFLFFAPTFTTIVLGIVALVGTIMGPQDLLAIIYYIYFAIVIVSPNIPLLLQLFVKSDT
jgi:hypothetical protein